jgi:hypothetical protein
MAGKISLINTLNRAFERYIVNGAYEKGRAKIKELLDSIGLDKKSVKAMADDIHKELGQFLDEKSKEFWEFTFTHMPDKVRLEIIELLTEEDQEKLAAISDNMRSIVSHYQMHVKEKARLNFKKIATVGDLQEVAGILKIKVEATGTVPEAKIIAVERGGVVRFYLERASYKKGKLLASIPANLL